MPLDPNKLPSKARFWFAPDAVSQALRVKSISGITIELTTSQTSGSVGASQDSKQYTESGATGEKVDNDGSMVLTPTSVESMESLMEWIEKYQTHAFSGGTAEEAAGTTGVLTLCNRKGTPVLEYNLTELIPKSMSSPTYKAGDVGDLEYTVNFRYHTITVKAA
jgi:hypothetical protein